MSSQSEGNKAGSDRHQACVASPCFIIRALEGELSSDRKITLLPFSYINTEILSDTLTDRSPGSKAESAWRRARMRVTALTGTSCQAPWSGQ
jgi:hypothetical protein